MTLPARDRAVSEPEVLFGHLAAGEVGHALRLIQHARLPDGAVGGHAAALLVEAVLRNDAIGPDDAELFVVLGRAGRIPVDRASEALVIERLLSGLRDDPARALAIARFRPDLAVCAAVILQNGTPERSKVGDPALVGHGTATATRTDHGVVDGGRSIFRSAAEQTFFAAVVRVFETDLVCPNVALHAALSWERLQGRLTGAERKVFFSALVDVVVFDSRRGFAPKVFFELDSGVHDDHHRAEKDAVKDRIITVAGYPLLRIRPDRDERSPEAFERLLRSIPLGDDPVY